MVGCRPGGSSRSTVVADEAIADTRLGADDLRVGWVALDLAAQLADEDAQIMQILAMRDAPDRG